MESRRRSPLRILAPLALAVFAIAVLLVLSSGGGSDDGGGGGASAAEKTRDLGPSTKTTSSRSSRSSSSSSSGRSSHGVYVVQRGDTLGGIADKTGVPVERLQELNPGIDQFSLVAGQRIKLR